MRLVEWLIPALLLTGGCGSGPTSNAPYPEPEVGPDANIVAPDETAGHPEKGTEPAVADNVTAAIPDDPGVRGMSPNQRRAYDRGFRDCRAGRYEPDLYSEAYRIGCAAAQNE